MDSRAKQRLTGAVILVALFVLLVPELLTGPRDADAPGTAAEDGMRRYTIDLNAANPSATPVDSQPAPAGRLAAAGERDRHDRTLAKPGDAAQPAAAEHRARLRLRGASACHRGSAGRCASSAPGTGAGTRAACRSAEACSGRLPWSPAASWCSSAVSAAATTRIASSAI